MIPDESFKKKEHILKSKDFRRVYKTGRSQRAGFIAVYCAKNGLEHNRIGFSISARSIKRASSRNRIRRLFREAYRKTKKSFKPGFDIVLIVKREPEKIISYQDAESLLLRPVKTLGVCA